MNLAFQLPEEYKHDDSHLRANKTKKHGVPSVAKQRIVEVTELFSIPVYQTKSTQYNAIDKLNCSTVHLL
jgi:hypothetical protein